MTNDISQSSKPQFREATNLLRGICAFSVLLWHYQHFFLTSESSIYILNEQPFFNIFSIPYTMGSIGVPIFWCISGLILSHSYNNTSRQTLWRFIIDRFSRLYPLHLITLIVVGILQFLSFHKVGDFLIYSNNDLHNFLLNLLFIQSWGFENGRSFNAPSWSVSTEILVYLVFFAALVFLKRFKLFGSLTILLICQFGPQLVPIIFKYLFFYQCLMFFMFGVCIYYLANIRFKFSTSIGVLVALCLILWAQTESQTSDYLLVASLVAFAAFCDQIRVSQRLKPLRRFGDLSYSVFLWHIPIQITIKLVQTKYSIDNSIAYNKLFFIFFIALTYFIGYLSFRFIEQPAQRIIRTRFANHIIEHHD